MRLTCNLYFTTREADAMFTTGSSRPETVTRFLWGLGNRLGLDGWEVAEVVRYNPNYDASDRYLRYAFECYQPDYFFRARSFIPECFPDAPANMGANLVRYLPPEYKPWEEAESSGGTWIDIPPSPSYTVESSGRPQPFRVDAATSQRERTVQQTYESAREQIIRTFRNVAEALSSESVENVLPDLQRQLRAYTAAVNSAPNLAPYSPPRSQVSLDDFERLREVREFVAREGRDQQASEPESASVLSAAGRRAYYSNRRNRSR